MIAAYTRSVNLQPVKKIDKDGEVQPQAKLFIEGKLRALVNLQDFDGSWPWSDEILDILGLKDLRAPRAPIKKMILATTLAIAYFRVFGDKGDDTWELIIDKGMGWLRQHPEADAEDGIDKAKALLAKT